MHTAHSSAENTSASRLTENNEDVCNILMYILFLTSKHLRTHQEILSYIKYIESIIFIKLC